MRQQRILLLDLYPTSSLAITLQEILSPFFHLNTQLQGDSNLYDAPSLWNKKITETISLFHPDMVLFILPTTLREQAGAMLQSLVKGPMSVPAIVATEASEPDEMFRLLKLGAADFVTPPLNAIDVLPRVWRLMEQNGREKMLMQSLQQKLGLKHLIGESPAFVAQVKRIPLIAKCDASVLILGETGTGKEICARAIHYLSLRAGKPFVPVNCGAIPIELAENELFGHERGAYTGASSSQPGLICEADGGTLFLDEIDCLPLLAQVKVLRFLQDREYRRLGSAKARRADLRIIAATNADLEEAVRKGRIRQDLYYRLNIIPITLPPLRERREDIPLLARHFLAKYAAEFGKQATGFSSDTMQMLMLYDWPGNVRELEHIVERAVALSENTLLGAGDITLPQTESSASKQPFQEAKARVVAQFEKSYIEDLLLIHNGNITRAAEAAQKDRRAFFQLMRKHHIAAQSYKSK